jgi:hypothetical protein
MGVFRRFADRAREGRFVPKERQNHHFTLIFSYYYAGQRVQQGPQVLDAFNVSVDALPCT